MTEKKCPRCGIVKSVTEFGVNKTRRDGLSGYCKSCSHELYKHYRKTYYERHPDAHTTAYYKNKEQCLAARHKYLDSRLELLWSLKTPCIKCGESRKCSIHFHHIDPSQKEVSLSDGGVGKARILEEVKKCICLCANCHEEFHYIYGHQPEHPVEALQKYLEGESKNAT